MHVKIYEETWQLIKDRISVLLKNGVAGLLLIFVVLYFFRHANSCMGGPEYSYLIICCIICALLFRWLNQYDQYVCADYVTGDHC